MKITIITEPKVYIINRQQVDLDEVRRFLADEGVEGWTSDARSASEFGVEFGGRLCYMSFKKPRPGGNSAYIKHILDVGHGSVLEHASWTFVVTGISRRCGEQLTRQRVGFSPSQLSQRYVDEVEGGTLDVVISPAMAKYLPEYERWRRAADAYRDGINRQNVDGEPDHTDGSRLVAEWVTQQQGAASAYEATANGLYGLMPDTQDKTGRRKQAREAARDLLPNATETKLQATMNARAIRHFIEMRGDASADAEIRRLAFKVLDVFRHEAPAIFGDYGIDRVAGVEMIRTPYPKV